MHMLRYFIALVCLLFPATGFSLEQKSAIQSITFSSDNQESEKVVFKLTPPINLPKILHFPGEKPRLVLDFAEADYRGKPTIVNKNAILAEDVRVALHTTPVRKVRAVIDLKSDRSITYREDFNVNSNTFTVVIEEASSPKTALPDAQKEKSGSAGEPGQHPIDKAAPPTVENKSAGNTDAPIAAVGTAVKSGSELPSNVAEAFKKERDATQTKAASLAGGDSQKQITQKDKGAEQPVTTLLNVGFSIVPNKVEMVRLKLSSFQEPVVNATEGATPQVSCEFPAMKIGGDVQNENLVRGKYVRSIQVSPVPDSSKVLVRLSLEPSHDYDLQQIFYRDESVFALIVSPLEENAGKTRQ